ncbi:hypothetical protein COU20_02890 [Candidatus Kaiserbacteria bacterium CG10_big_fil_rev_8_21_14_0_10_59_10]|uniref:DUF5667 domain-containing protein n=1 Tax=Candidatus Kaiserbacteria bacterium CG10_big_fil_rev_8_21_14_0_10_59_10 TaxID=1974612 RepID=A0A2H0U9I4_9BACT|nr:MAG: hypothetical protein COU20_02890 [Candidatus Kaiserbacteria bacterium CG10_big_fil_rev_8_21_14_0_10_59_10]
MTQHDHIDTTFEALIKEAAREPSLSAKERERMAYTLTEYMRHKPLSHTSAIFQEEPHREARAYAWIPSLKRPAAVLSILGLFALSGGVSYAAEEALPGDLLYAVKTGVNEPIRGALALSSSAAALWQMRLVERRIEEAAALAAAGRLNEETGTTLRANLERHAIAAAALLESASNDDAFAAEASLRFEARLAEHEALLSQLSERDGEALSAVLASVLGAREHASRMRASAGERAALSVELGNETALNSMRRAAQKQLETSASLVRESARALSSVSHDLVATELENAAEVFAEGEELMGQNAAKEALHSFEHSLAASEKVSAFIRTNAKIQRHVRHPSLEPSLSVKRRAQKGADEGERGDTVAPTLSPDEEDEKRQKDVPPALPGSRDNSAVDVALTSSIETATTTGEEEEQAKAEEMQLLPFPLPPMHFPHFFGQ